MTMKEHLLSMLLVLLSVGTTTLAQPAAAPTANSPLALVVPPPAPVVPPPAPVVPPPLVASLPPAPALPPTPPLPPPPPPRRHADILKVLEKAGDFTVLLRLLKSTHVADVINAQLGDRSGAVTFFAPRDSAFARLKDGTLNSLTNEKQVELVQFHAVPTYLSTTQFQTVSNPLRTDAGGSNIGEFPLNVTTNGDEVSIFTGINTAKVVRTIYADKELAVYEVDKVLQPMGVFAPKKAVAPSPEKPNTDNEPNTTTPELTTTPSASNADKMKNNFAVFGMFTTGLLALFASNSF